MAKENIYITQPDNERVTAIIIYESIVGGLRCD